MKGIKLITLLATLLLTGCVYYTHPGCKPQRMPTSNFTVVNNSGYTLKVYQDGAYIGDLGVGEVRPVHGTLFGQRTVITVTGYAPGDIYVGSATWVYEYNVPEAWTVTRLSKPVEPQ